MKWNFWAKTPKKAEPPAWPTDTYESVKYLDSLPFREWKSPLVDVKPSLESAAYGETGSSHVSQVRDVAGCSRRLRSIANL
jgi:hypothetical protein